MTRSWSVWSICRKGIISIFNHRIHQTGIFIWAIHLGRIWDENRGGSTMIMLSPDWLQHTYGWAVESCNIMDSFPIKDDTFLSSSNIANFWTEPRFFETEFWLLLIGIYLMNKPNNMIGFRWIFDSLVGSMLAPFWSQTRKVCWGRRGKSTLYWFKTI